MTPIKISLGNGNTIIDITVKEEHQEINKAEFLRLCGLSYPTIYKYLGIAERRL